MIRSVTLVGGSILMQSEADKFLHHTRGYILLHSQPPPPPPCNMMVTYILGHVIIGTKGKLSK